MLSVFTLMIVPWPGVAGAKKKGKERHQNQFFLLHRFSSELTKYGRIRLIDNDTKSLKPCPCVATVSNIRHSRTGCGGVGFNSQSLITKKGSCPSGKQVAMALYDKKAFYLFMILLFWTTMSDTMALLWSDCVNHQFKGWREKKRLTNKRNTVTANALIAFDSDVWSPVNGNTVVLYVCIPWRWCRCFSKGAKKYRTHLIFDNVILD